MHHLHNVRANVINAMNMHELIKAYLEICVHLQFNVVFGPWKNDPIRMAVTITVEPDNAKVCNIYTSAHKDGQLRWIMVNCVQAKSYESELSKIRDFIRFTADQKQMKDDIAISEAFQSVTQESLKKGTTDEMKNQKEILLEHMTYEEFQQFQKRMNTMTA